jgi:uncharacterized membrane protein YiaA
VIEILRNRFDYDPSNVCQPLVYKRKVKQCDIGSRVGHVKDNKGLSYAKAKVLGKEYFLHRLIYIFFNGEIESRLVIDHINGNTLDNRIENLQAISNAQNKKLGTFKNYKNNPSGLTGVNRYLKDKWKVQFRLGGKFYYFGVFSDLEKAKEVCAIKRSEIFAECRR